MKKIFIFLVISLMLAGGVGYYMYNKPKAAMESMQSYSVLQAADLVQKFETDESAAEVEFLDKTIEVSGIVKEKNESGIILEGSDEITGVLCEFENPSDLASVEIKQKIVVKGICTGKLLDVVLSRCIVVK